jgi:hypothetical protein
MSAYWPEYTESSGFSSILIPLLHTQLNIYWYTSTLKNFKVYPPLLAVTPKLKGDTPIYGGCPLFLSKSGMSQTIEKK